MTIVQLRQPKKVVMTFYFYSAEFFMYIVKDIKCMCLPLKFAKEMCRKCIPFVQCGSHPLQKIIASQLSVQCYG